MRFIPTNCIKQGMILGDNLFNSMGNLMLSKGEALTVEYIESIKRLKYNGLYIDDDISKDIEVINTISEKVKAESVKTVRDTFIFGEKTKTLRKQDIKNTKKQVNVIVDEILRQKHLMVNMIDLKVFDDYTYHHSVNVAVISIVLGVALGFTESELCTLGSAAIFHDVGKVFIDKDIINKPGKLTHEEFEVMKEHSLLGCMHLRREGEISDAIYMGILDHHENYSGTGYPNNLEGDNISLHGKIISVADVYDALTSDRPYRKALLPSEAMEYIMGNTELQFDPEVVEIFVKKVAPYPKGTCVSLSNGLIGIVLNNNEELNMRPVLRIFRHEDTPIEPYTLSLSDKENLNITIVGIVNDLDK